MRKICFIVLVSATNVVLALGTQIFSDVAKSQYKEAIYHLQEKGILQGYADGTFQPQKNINRAEFLKIVIETFYPNTVYDDYRQKCFDDVNDTSLWYVPYACKAKELYLIDGYDNRYLKPENTISFVESAKIIANMSGTQFSETENPWYEPYVRFMLQKKLVSPSIDAFNHEMTRADISEMISRYIRLQEQRLDSYLSFRNENYGETETPQWEDLSTVAYGQTSPEALMQAYNIERTHRAVIDTPHPGEFVEGSYLSTYNQWTKTSYEPSVENHSLSLEKEALFRESLFKLLNEKRYYANRNTFVIDPVLNTVAQNFAEHIVINGFYSHMDKWGKKPQQRVKDAGYEGTISESMVWRKRDVSQVVNWWEESDLHWNNIMTPEYKNVGIGVSEEPGGGYLVILITGS